MRIGTKIAALATSGTLAGLIGVSGLTNGAHAACPASNQSTAGTNVGPLYASGSGAPSPSSLTSPGFVGVGGAQGYAEANGTAVTTSGPQGYIVASNGSQGVVVTSGTPPTAAPC